MLTANAPETKDNDFTWKDFQARNNNELVAILGNFVNRAMVMTWNYFGGVVQELGDTELYDISTQAKLLEGMVDDLFVRRIFKDIREELESKLDTFHFRDALQVVMSMARVGNKYLADTEPWKLIAIDPVRVQTILNNAIQIVANISIALEPFMPSTAEELRRMLGIDAGFAWQRLGSFDLLPAGHQLGETKLLFEKIDDEVIERQVQKLLDAKHANEVAEHHAAPIREAVAFDDFTRLDIRVGRVTECTKVPKADKLLQFKIDDGLGGRTIVSGIAKHYAPEELVGRQVCFVANLEPRRIKGITSEGMILSAEGADGRLAVISPEKEVEPGSAVK